MDNTGISLHEKISFNKDPNIYQKRTKNLSPKPTLIVALCKNVCDYWFVNMHE